MATDSEDEKLRKYTKQISLIAKLNKEIEREFSAAIERAKNQPELQRRKIDISLIKNPDSLDFLNKDCEGVNNFLYSLIADIPLLYSVGLGEIFIEFGKIPLKPIPDQHIGYTNLRLNKCGLEIARNELRYMADHPWETERNSKGLFYFNFAGKPLVCWQEMGRLEIAANTIVHNCEPSSYGYGTPWYKPQITVGYLRESLYSALRKHIKTANIPKLKRKLSKLEKKA